MALETLCSKTARSAMLRGATLGFEQLTNHLNERGSGLDGAAGGYRTYDLPLTKGVLYH